MLIFIFCLRQNSFCNVPEMHKKSNFLFIPERQLPTAITTKTTTATARATSWWRAARSSATRSAARRSASWVWAASRTGSMRQARAAASRSIGRPWLTGWPCSSSRPATRTGATPPVPIRSFPGRSRTWIRARCIIATISQSTVSIR